jgi:hypothetical protein
MTCLPALLQAQSLSKSNATHLQVGINRSRIVLDTLRTEAVIMPYFGANITQNLTPKINLVLGSQVSFRAGEAIVPQSITYRNTYLDLQIIAQYHPVPDLALLAGAQVAFAARTTAARPDSTGRTFVPTTGFAKNNYEALIGTDLRLRPYTHLRLLYTLPISPKLQYTNLQAGLVVNTQAFKIKKENTKKTAAQQQIKQLKNSVLFVCLAPNDTLNPRIMRNFAQVYHFTPVYFFYNDKIINIVQKNWQNHLFDAQNQPVTLQPSTPYYIAQHTQPTPDTTRTIDSYVYEKRNGKLEKLPNYYQAGITDVVGWVLFDQNFVQYQPPLPSFVRTVRGNPKNILTGIGAMHQQLDFYYKNNAPK